MEHVLLSVDLPFFFHWRAGKRMQAACSWEDNEFGKSVSRNGHATIQNIQKFLDSWTPGAGCKHAPSASISWSASNPHPARPQVSDREHYGSRTRFCCLLSLGSSPPLLHCRQNAWMSPPLRVVGCVFAVEGHVAQTFRTVADIASAIYSHP